MPRVSPSMLVALLALFVALGGTGYAAAKLNGRNLVNRSVSAAKIKRNTLGGKEINEAKLGVVPNAARLGGQAASAFLAVNARAADAAKLGGKGPGAYLAATGKATDADRLDGRDAAEFLGAGAKAADSETLDGLDSGAFLGAAAKAADADKLDGLDSAAFVSASKMQNLGPVVMAMPAVNNATVVTTLTVLGSFTISGICTNQGGLPQARIGIRSVAQDYFLGAGENTSHSVTVIPAGAAVQNIAIASASGGTQWDAANRTFSAVVTPASGAGAIHGAVTTIADNGATKQCYHAVSAVMG